jgi:hypothetical protein
MGVLQLGSNFVEPTGFYPRPQGLDLLFGPFAARRYGSLGSKALQDSHIVQLFTHGLVTGQNQHAAKLINSGNMTN